MRDEVIAFVVLQCNKIPAEKRLSGSREVIESLIGKGKRLEGQQSKSGFTRQVFAMAGSVVNRSQEVIQSALKSVGMKRLKSWCIENLPQSLQSKRRRDLGTNIKEQKQDKQIPQSTPTF